MNSRRTATTKEAGFSLVELMIALALSMIIVAVVAILFSATSKNRGDLERSNRLEESTAYAVDYLAEEIRSAGFFSELSLQGTLYNVVGPCSTGLSSQGYAMTPLAVPTPIVGYSKNDAIPGTCVPNRKVGTGAITIHRLAIDATPAASANGAAYLQVSGCSSDLSPWTIGAATASFTLKKIGCAAVADTRRIEAHTYYIASCNECGVDTIPTLKRISLEGTTLVVTPIADGIENLAFEYGWDLNNDGVADEWREKPSSVGAGANTLWQNVMAVRVYVQGRALDGEAAYTDGGKRYYMGSFEGYTNPTGSTYKRLVADALVRVNNPSMQRETP